jgi:DNA topoisomerase II
MKRIKPWYRGFTGNITQNIDSTSYTVEGKYEARGTKLAITELPIRKWTGDYKAFLESLIQTEDLIDDIKEYHKDNSINF